MIEMVYNKATNESAGAVRKHPPAWHSGLEPEMRPKSIPALTNRQTKNFWDHVEVHQPAGCWEWTGYREPHGYGTIRTTHHGKFRAHRVAYALLVGDTVLDLDHLCRNPGCVNPDHLEPVETGENTRRAFSPIMLSKRKTTCVRGHDLVAGNFRVTPKGYRICRDCETINRRLGRSRRQAVQS